MSSSYIVEPKDSEKDNTLIILYKDDKTLQVDHETLQNVILNETNPDVSVVRLSHSNEETTLIVDPPQGQFVSETSAPAGPTSNAETPGLVDHDWLFAPESLEQVENALRSERAIEVLGENVAAMLDMLSVEDEQNAIRRCIALDHCYTSLNSPRDPEPNNPLPDAESPVTEDAQAVAQTGVNNNTAASLTKPKISTRLSNSTQSRRNAAPTSFSNSNKIPVNSKNSTNASFSEKDSIGGQSKDDLDDEFSLTESSTESEPSDDDYDFGPRGPRRAGIRARGGRKGLTTRGGARRRGGNKLIMDSEQVKRLDMEMAAAVNAMKSPEKEDNKPVIEKPTIARGRKIKTLPVKKKEEPVFKPQEPQQVAEKPLQTTNEVKAHLISTNMFKGDMIITKPGEGRNNQKVMLVQKHVIMKANELKNLNIKKPVVVSKGKVVNQLTLKNTPVKDQQVKSATLSTNSPAKDTSLVATQGPKIISVIQLPVQAHINLGPKTVRKVPDIKKERRKSSESQEVPPKVEPEVKPEVKTPESSVPKKHVKKEHRKPQPVLETLVPALFSTPDIIRRVGSEKAAETVLPTISPVTNPKSSVSPVTSNSPVATTITSTAAPLAPVPTAAPIVTTTTPVTPSTTPVVPSETVAPTSAPVVPISSPVVPALVPSVPLLSTSAPIPASVVPISESVEPSMTPVGPSLMPVAPPVPEPMEVDPVNEFVTNEIDKSSPQVAPPAPTVESQLQMHIEGTVSANEIESKGTLDNKPPSADELQPSLDPGGIENEENLLATLGMEATKHEEDLLAEALLLQEELGVDLTDSTALEDQTVSLSDSLISSSNMSFEASLPAPPADISTETKLSSDAIPTTPIISAQNIKKSPLASTVNPNLDLKKKIVKNEGKEPIQIIRGGRVITLPPIEAPATRSKRAQASRSDSQNSKKSNDSKSLYTSLGIDDDEEDEEEEEEANSDSEDDPHRLWCICRKPHNNRFMICCDVCEDWFHGTCVSISKSMGQEMEAKGIEWVCPPCQDKKAKQSKNKNTSKVKNLESTNVSLNESTNRSGLSVNVTPVQNPAVIGALAGSTGTLCIVCKKSARETSVYCSDACILAHASESARDKPLATAAAAVSKIQKSPSEAAKKYMFFDKKTGKMWQATNIQPANLKIFLKDHPSYELVKPNSINNLQIGGRTIKTIQAPGTKPAKPAPLAQKGPEQAKMVYAKVLGSKQTILAPSTKKIITIPSPQQPPGVQMKQKTVTPGTSPKTPQPLKQTTLKLTPKTPTSAPKLVTSTPKSSLQKKSEVKTPSQKVQVQLKTPPPKKSESDFRSTVEKALTDSLGTRIKEVNDLSLTREEISELAHNIELELYKCYKDTSKYRTKYRSLQFNIKDAKNLTLFRKIAEKSISPYNLVRLTPEEMASQELAAWREQETKHQLDMIKKNELDLLAQAKSIVVKTHKGEQIIEKDGTVDTNTSVQDIVSALKGGESIGEEKKEKDSAKLDEKRKKEKDRSRDRNRRDLKEKGKNEKRDRSGSKSHRHRSKDLSKTRDRSRDKSRERKRNKERKKDKDRERDKDHDKKDKSKDKKKHKRNKSNKSHHRDKDKKEDKKEAEKKPEAPSVLSSDKQPIEERLWRHVDEENTTNTLDGNESDVSDREPSSTVTIKTPDINEEPVEREPEPEAERSQRGPLQAVWRGFVHMVDVAKFFITAQEVSGYSRDLMDDLPDTVDVVGRICPETVWDYISKMKKNSSKEILVIRLTAANDEEKIPYITLYSYLNSRSRLGVMGQVSVSIKDFYIVPLPNNSKIPSVLLPFDGPGFEENRQNLLLGIIVRNRRKRPLSIEPVISSHKISKKEEKSYTPPPSKDDDKHKVSEVVRNIIDSATISKIVPELSSKIDFSSSPEKNQDDDENEPYSPGESKDSLSLPMDTGASLLVPGSTSLDMLTIEELNRKIAESQQEIQNISSSLTEVGKTAENPLPGFGPDEEEPYSPSNSRSFTPPPIAKFAQPILDKVSDITIPPNLQEILANVKRQETNKVDSYLPPKPGATFLPSSSSSLPKDKFGGSFLKTPPKEKSTGSTLSQLSEADLIRKAEEELAAVSAAEDSSIVLPDLSRPPPPLPHVAADPFKTLEQPKPPGIEDEESPTKTPTKMFKSGVVISVKRKLDDNESSSSPHKVPRTKVSRWGQGPNDT